MDEFEQWYRRYPRKTGRADALKAWHQTAAQRPALPVLLAALDRYVAWRAALERKRDFVPALLYPASYLRGQRWEDEFDLPAAAPAPAPVVDEAAERAAQLRRMEVARAESGWADVMGAYRTRLAPLGGWSDDRIVPCLAAVGGWPAVERAVSTRGAVEALKQQYVRTWLERFARRDEVVPSGNVVALNRVVNHG